MVSAKLMGGLGNQFFQIATAHALALRNNDVSGFDLNQCYTPNQGHTSNRYKNTIFKNINNIDFGVNHFNDLIYDNISNIYCETKFSYNEIPYTKDMFLMGYFQSEKYFKDYSEDIKNLFNIPKDIECKVSKFIDSLNESGTFQVTSIHVRRGDYLKHPTYHPICDVEYYKKAMSTIGNTYIILSDDIDWCKNNFKGKNIHFSPFTEEIEDLALMINCSNNIIANSSFSWWGAYLNKNPKKTIVAPSKWFGIDGPKDTQDLIPENWIIV